MVRNINFDNLLKKSLTKEQKKRLEDKAYNIIENVHLVLRKKNTGKACVCKCHIKGITVKHIISCCEFTYKPFINQDGSIDQKLLFKYIKAYIKNESKGI